MQRVKFEMCRSLFDEVGEDVVSEFVVVHMMQARQRVGGPIALPWDVEWVYGE